MIQFIAGVFAGALFMFMILAIVSAGSLESRKEEKEIKKFKEKL